MKNTSYQCLLWFPFRAYYQEDLIFCSSWVYMKTGLFEMLMSHCSWFKYSLLMLIWGFYCDLLMSYFLLETNIQKNSCHVQVKWLFPRKYWLLKTGFQKIHVFQHSVYLPRYQVLWWNARHDFVWFEPNTSRALMRFFYPSEICGPSCSHDSN